MIDRNNIHELLKDLDLALSKKGEKRDLTIFGSGALLLQKIARETRRTIDIDLIEPMMDMTLQLIAAEVGERVGLEMGWLNSAGNIFSRSFPKGWKDRTQNIYRGTALKVKSLGRKDLIATKFNAFCGRDVERDLHDLIDLCPTKAELIFSKKWILSLENGPDAKRIDDAISIVSKKTKDFERGK
jgi:hypothetical protein